RQEQRGALAAIAVFKDARPHVQNAKKHGCKHRSRITSAKRGVGSRHGGGDRILLAGCYAQNGYNDGHERAGRKPFAANIADGESDAVRIKHEIVIKVAANIVGGPHGSANIDSAPKLFSNIRIGQERLLYDRSASQFFLLPALIEDLGCKPLKGRRKIHQLNGGLRKSSNIRSSNSRSSSAESAFV